jgi:hypothetical protein
MTRLLTRSKSESAMKKSSRSSTIQLTVDALEARDMLSISSLWFSGSTLVVKTDNASTSVAVNSSGTNIVISELGTFRTWSYAASLIGKVEFQGGAGNDCFRNDTSKASVAFGFGGQDVLLGGSSSDELVGGGGKDRLNGRGGSDSLWGGNGDDVLISIDAGVNDYIQGDAGRDIIWADRNATYTDRIYGAEAVDKCQLVSSFANGADRTLNGDRILDPTPRYISGTDASGNAIWSAGVHRRFANNPLFASTGPSVWDIRQGALGDCWLLAALGSIAHDNPHALRQNIVDFDDGTYGVRLGNNFYRVDDDLQVTSLADTSPVLARLGGEGSMWVAIAEKAYAHYRSGNNYANLNGGWSVEVNRAFQSASAGAKDLTSYTSATAMANDIYNRWNSYQAVTIGFVDNSSALTISGTPLIDDHQYMVFSVSRDAYGRVTSITLRNPWGYDGAGSDSDPSDGFITVTPAQLFGLRGQLNWGSV